MSGVPFTFDEVKYMMYWARYEYEEMPEGLAAASDSAEATVGEGVDEMRVLLLCLAGVFPYLVLE